MTGAQYGFSGLKGSLSNNADVSILYSLIENLNFKFIPVRVVDVVLDETYPSFESLGGWNAIGSIRYEQLDSPEREDTSKLIAKPFFPNQKHIPLKNEIVLLAYLPDTEALNDLDGKNIYYYISTLSLWNHPHHNAFPNPLNNKSVSDSQLKDYQSIEGGNVRRVQDNSTEINLNSTKDNGGKFVEKTDIHPLLPFTGDHIVEGRFGNSIRLGSTIKSKSSLANKWSNSGDEGDPITIFRNGQPSTSNSEGWVPVVEDINKDLSSVYLTSTQKLPINVASKNYTGIRDTVITYPQSYNKPQIVLNSGRLLFNSATDSILLSSAKSISLSSIDDIGISSAKEVTLTGDMVKLGSKNAGESIILGDSFIKQFNVLLNTMSLLCDSLIAEPALKGGTPGVASQLKTMIELFQDKNYLSRFSKTI